MWQGARQRRRPWRASAARRGHKLGQVREARFATVAAIQWLGDDGFNRDSRDGLCHSRLDTSGWTWRKAEGRDKEGMTDGA